MTPARSAAVASCTLIACVLSVCQLSSAAASSPPVVILDARGGFDSYHNLASGDGFSTFRSTISESGFSITPRASFEATDLAGAAAVILLQPYSGAAAYTPTEVAALRAFTTAGGSLLVMADGGTGSSADYLNALSQDYGVSYASIPSDALGTTVTGFEPHPLTVGVSSIGIDYQRRLTVSGRALDLTVSGGSADVLAVSGGAVFLSDSSIFMNPDAYGDAGILSGDNRQLAQNILSSVTVPEQAPWASSVALTALAAWRLGRSILRHRVDR